MKFQKITVTDWKQFQLIDIDFHPNLTVLTGANGSGKTTIINLLAKHFGWTINELATPAKDEATGFFKFFARWFKSETKKNTNSIGEISYSNNTKATLVIQNNNEQAQYNINLNNAQPIKGLNIPSHRPVFYYQPVPHISTQKRTKEQAYQLAYQSVFYKLFTENANINPLTTT